MNNITLNKIDTLIEEFNARNLIPGYESYQGYQEGKKTNNQLLGMILGPEGVKGATSNTDKNISLKDAYTKSNTLRSAGWGAGLGGMGAGAEIIKNRQQFTPDEMERLHEFKLEDSQRGEQSREILDYIDSDIQPILEDPLLMAAGTLGSAAVFTGLPAINYGLGKLSGVIKNKLTNQKK